MTTGGGNDGHGMPRKFESALQPAKICGCILDRMTTRADLRLVNFIHSTMGIVSTVLMIVSERNRYECYAACKYVTHLFWKRK